MSYEDDFEFNSLSWDPATPMILDVLGLQYLYGKDMTTNTNDNEYNLLGRDFYYTIWDAGGTDTVDASSNAEGWVIELPDARLSELVNERVGFASPVVDVSLPSPTRFVWLEGDIENAKGSTGADIIDGNPMDNRLVGYGGADQLYGGAGSDTIEGGDGDDTIEGGDTGADVRDMIFGGPGEDSAIGGYGNDEINGGTGGDILAGGYGVDHVRGNSGDDTITGSAFSDLLFGGPGFDFVNGGFGFDRVNGGADGDRFFHIGDPGHASDWIQDYDAAEGDVLLYGGQATANDFRVITTETQNAGQDGVDEAFVVHRPTGQILWALVDGAGQDSMNLRISGGAEVDLFG
jgi:Ca2+-binding RTX toxin-like protein